MEENIPQKAGYIFVYCKLLQEILQYELVSL